MLRELPGPGDIVDCATDLSGCLGDATRGAGEAIADSAVGAFANAIGSAASEVLKSLNGVWLQAGSPSSLNPQGQTGLNGILNETQWIVGYVAVASLLVAAARMAYERKGQPMQQALLGMWKVILVSAVAPLIAGKLYEASDAYAADVYEKAQLGENAETMLGLTTLTSPGLILIFGLLIMLAGFVQIILMYIRLGVLIMLIGTLPIAAASSMTGWGEGWWKKHLGWLIAWLLYKPAAALIIYSATAMTQDDRAVALENTIAGMGMLILSVFALPALLKLIVPATAALGSTSGGTVAMNFANNIATGAINIASGGMSSSGGGGGGGRNTASQGPAGSPSTGAGSPPGGTGGGGAGTVGGAASAGAAGATAGATVAVQAAATVAQAGLTAANEVTNSLDDNDGNKGHNQ
ncbi:hypothetical protein [Streptomyces sp. NPDC006610]|jgi:hypothetical protein|uniref:hypothetical protein n=1 Tax=Streptomyces sp. NPDC006610 TaxID=3154584 RepID=UPI0033B9C37B